MDIVLRPLDPARRVELPVLAQSLRRSGQIQGQIEVLWSQPARDRLGPMPEAVSVAVAAVGTGGAITVAAREIVRALVRRNSLLDVEISVRRGEREIRVHARGISSHDLRHMTADSLSTFIDRLASMLRSAAGLDEDRADDPESAVAREEPQPADDDDTRGRADDDHS
jgi:hypothetical protein